MTKLSIIIPNFNEENTIAEILKKVAQAKLPEGIKKEIIIVDDGSNDNSKLKIQSSKFFKQIKLLSHKKNMGKGAAIKTGLESSTGDLIIIQDADLEYNPADYARLLEPILRDQAKVVYGSRLIDYPLRLWGPDKTIMPFHLLANRGLTFFTNLLYGSKLTDMETCYKLFKKEVLQNIQLEANGFEFEPEITAKILKSNVAIAEVPIKVKLRTYREGKKIGIKDGFLAIWTILKYRFI